MFLPTHGNPNADVPLKLSITDVFIPELVSGHALELLNELFEGHVLVKAAVAIINEFGHDPFLVGVFVEVCYCWRHIRIMTYDPRDNSKTWTAALHT